MERNSREDAAAGMGKDATYDSYASSTSFQTTAFSSNFYAVPVGRQSEKEIAAPPEGRTA